MRARLRASVRPDRIFDVVLDVAKAAGLIGRRRVLDSTALYDAVATQDTVTMIRSSIRALLKAAPEPLAAELRSVLKRDDDYTSPGKPACNWDDEAAREALVDALAPDAHAVLAELDDRALSPEVKQAADLVATVVGEDLEQRDDGVFRIARRVAPDRVISTVDPEARHGHKTSARGFDGYKGHVAIDPDSELITRTAVSAANAGDASVAQALLADVLEADANKTDLDETSQASSSTDVAPATSTTAVCEPSKPEVYGDASYGTADLVERLEGANVEANVKVQPPSGFRDRFVGRYRMLSQRGACASARPAGQLADRRFCFALRWLFAPRAMHDIQERSRAAPPSKAPDAHSRARGPARPELEAALPRDPTEG